ncbi:site-specific integrase [Halobacillus kuroshimensis]|uniref:Tyrosine-type recombinase/integrase n=2 Tax=Halobacillus TaxID=45667 RepID=A0A845E4S0_9BACI|nr:MULTISPECIES: site-specific integrase [Halobacillus]MBN8236848.1 site-specific integrase [Halobacillus kuroshimensis]MCA1021806.1 site-specific integrase [Halobacillus litoralis]MYL50270.1 tyrosine-type recombinase/integrase [Halobacillus litoralis]
MNFVQPIRDPEVIRAIKKYLREDNDRNYMMFVVGINSGLRISDILPLRVKDAKRPYFSIREKKTSKQKRIDMTPSLKKELKWYVEGKEDHEFLFKSREGINKPIGRSMAYKILRSAAEYVSLDEIGTHTLRKTFGYHFYKQTKDVALLQEIFNHSSPAITLKYIGINQDGIDKAMKEFKI